MKHNALLERVCRCVENLEDRAGLELLFRNVFHEQNKNSDCPEQCADGSDSNEDPSTSRVSIPGELPSYVEI